MVFRIRNTLNKEDYKRIAERLKDKKRLDGDEEEGVTHYHDYSGREYIPIPLFERQELELPLAYISGRYDEAHITTEDAENYMVWVKIEYESRLNRFADTVAYLKSHGLSGYEIASGQKTLDFKKVGNDYRVRCIGSEIVIGTLREKKILINDLKNDIESCMLLAEFVVNGVYEFENVMIDLEITARLHKKARHGKVNKFEKTIALEKPTTTFDQIGGCEEAKSELDLLSHGLSNPEAFTRWGLNYPRGILLHGVPGTGKTLLAKAMANAAHASLFCVSVTDVLTCWYGESPKLIGKVFDVAKKNAPSIVLFDEIDALVQNRQEVDEETVKVISVFLQRMDGIKGMDKVTVIGTTNIIGNIDPAMLRPGRFDKIISVPLPSKQAREDIFRIHSTGKRVLDNIDYAELAGKSDGFTGADINAIIQNALGVKLKEEIKTGKADLPPLSTDDLLESIKNYKREEPRQGPAIKKEMYA